MAEITFSWWEWLPFHRWRIVGVVDEADEIPHKIPKNGAILVGSKQYPKWLTFDCPCRSGHRIMLNADRGRRPFWLLQEDPSLSIHPSIDFVHPNGRCHFFIRNGRISWAYEREE